MMVVGCKGCSRKKSPPPTTSSSSNTLPTDRDGRVGFKNYTLVVPATGPRIWAAEVKSGRADSKTGKLILDGITCHLYEQGKEVLRVTADTGTATVQEKTVRMELTGHVQAVEQQRGQRLTTEVFRWNSIERRIHAERFRWTSEKMTLSADAGSFSNDLTEATFHGHVRMETTDAGGRR